MARGLDVGTCFLVCASKKDNDDKSSVDIRSIRDAFLDIEADQATLNMLKMSNVSYVPGEGENVFIIGEPALNMANLFKREARRPLSKGVISAGDTDAERMLVILLKNILGEPLVEDELVYYSIPAAPLNSTKDILYHEAMFKKIIESLGYRAVSMNEAAAIVYSNCSKEMFTALSTSCLTPGQKVITDKGFKNIEDIKGGDEVLTKGGAWVECFPTSRYYKGKVHSIDAYGGPRFELTSDHKVWVKREEDWCWVEAKNVRSGDFVKQPWDSFAGDSKVNYLCITERVTSSKEVSRKNLMLTAELAELIGFWLGDGHLELKHGAICFTQHEDEVDNIERISFLVENLFGKSIAVYPHGEHAVRIKFYSKGFATWLNDNGYASDKTKRAPWKVSDLSESVLMHLLRGLIYTDGDFSLEDRHVGFTSTSRSLAQFVYLGLQRLCCNPHLNVRPPRVGKNLVDGNRYINGIQENYGVAAGGYHAVSFINWLESPYSMNKKSYINGESICRVTSVTERDYEGSVYDLSVIGDDHSFCLPGAAIHNCGAGMVNTSLVYQTMVGSAFSLETSGDWIDQSVATALGITATKVMSIKEKGVNLLNPEEGDPKFIREREAIAVYYKNLIHRVIDTIKKEFKKDEAGIELPGGIPWVIGGGTTKAINFLEFFKQEFSKIKDFPIEISEIRLAEDQLNDVAKGLMIAAMNE